MYFSTSTKSIHLTKRQNQISSNVCLAWIKDSLLKGGWAPILVFGLNIAVYLLGLYQKFLHADVPVHFLGGIAITYFFYKSIKCALKLDLLGSPSALLLRIFLFTLVCFTVVFWEFLEWVMETLFHLVLQNSIDDTLFDMAVGILGGIVILAVKWKRIWMLNKQTLYLIKYS